jgi:hypothetical protein
MPCRHVGTPGQLLDIQGPRIFPIDPIANTTQPRQIFQIF